jgi:hypothetical protein
MTFEEAISSITPEMDAWAREAALREPDMTDPDAPGVPDEELARAYRPGRPFISANEEAAATIRHYASLEECPVKREEILARLHRYETAAEITTGYAELECAEAPPIAYSFS